MFTLTQALSVPLSSLPSSLFFATRSTVAASAVDASEGNGPQKVVPPLAGFHRGKESRPYGFQSRSKHPRRQSHSPFFSTIC